VLSERFLPLLRRFVSLERLFAGIFGMSAPRVYVSGSYADTTTPTHCAGIGAAIRFRMRTRL